MGSRIGVLAVLAAMAAASASAEPVRVAPALDGSKSCAKPEYPVESRRLNEEGSVVLRFLVGPEGVPIRSEILSSSGFERLDRAAQDALSLCHFKPATIDGRPAPEPGWAQLRYTWKLQAAQPGLLQLAQGWEPKCSAQPSAADFAGQLAEIAAGTRIGGTARFVVPRASPLLSACHAVFLRSQAEALRKAALFDRVDLDETGIAGVRPKSSGEDYSFWFENGAIAASYRGGPRIGVGDGRAGLGVWIAHLGDSLKTARDLQDPKNTALGSVLMGLQPYYAYRGKEYLSSADLEEGVRADASEEGRALPPVQPIGRSARIILVPEAVLIGWAEVRSAQAQPAERHRTAVNQLGWGLAAYAQSKGWAGALHSTGMFKDVSIEEGVFEDPPLSGYDAVIWNEPASPYRWKVRDSSGAMHEIPPPDNAAAWISAIRAALVKETTQ